MRSHDAEEVPFERPATDPAGAGRHRNPLSPAMRAWIERAAGAPVIAVESLPPSSTRKCRITVAREDGHRELLLLRRYHDAERLGRDPW